MTMPAFDTLEAARELEAAGASKPLAEAMVKTFNVAINENVATKGDITALKTNIAEVKSEIIKGTIGIVLGVAAVQTTLTVGLVVGLLS